jgi:SAM-dependent methyltransferase
VDRKRLGQIEGLPDAAGDQSLARGAGVLERTAGRSGELVLRQSGANLEIIADGMFLISSVNAASCEALITAGLASLRNASAPRLAQGDAPRIGLKVLVGGLGLGYTLDAALVETRVEHVTVVEYEPVIVDWFRRYGEGRAERLAAGEGAGRARVLIGDVADVMRESPGAFDLVALDTDNGPDWLVRESNAGLYDEAGLALAHDALRPGGVAVFWSPAHYDWFAARLATTFSQVNEVAAYDHVSGRRHEYTLYVARREVD